MARANGKTDQERVDLDLDQEAAEGRIDLDVEHELPAAEAEAEPSAQTAVQPLSQPPSAEAQRDAELAKLRVERDNLVDRLARLQAEFENARKRAQREQYEYRDYAVAEAVKLLLPVLDNFDLALKAEGSKADLRAGIELIRRQMDDALGKLGVAPVEARGEDFDPRVHEAIDSIETSEEPENRVIEELRRGYKLKDRLLRPATVRVARHPRK